MNVSLSWLNAHIDLSDHSPQQLDDLLTFAGIEVEGIAAKGVPSELIVVAQIKEAIQHPDADKLKVCQVDAGEGQLRQIVCGAKNYKVGDKVPCALPGADLGGGFIIKEGKLRGVASLGMLCGASEIGFVDAEDGLMILPEDSEVGARLIDLYDSDTQLEIEITPNRPDLLSHRGMARELAALADKALKPAPAAADVDTAPADAIGLITPTCPYYTATRISGVTVGDSPTWLKQRLEAIGLRPINNIVDITNFVLHDLGHPLHAFDAAKVTGDLTVRPAADGEIFKALDEADYTLTPEDAVISDASGAALALAGIMGGLDSGVTASTTDIILEAAYFTPSEIRRTSRRLILSSDSSYRFERGSDPQQALTSAKVAIALILEIAGGEIEGRINIAGAAPVLTESVTLDHARLDQLMAENISLDAAQSILTKLGLERASSSDDGSTWQIPSYRLDLQRHIDLVEEIARVHGLDQITSSFSGTFVEPSSVDASYDAQLDLKRSLSALGFYETQTIKLISDSQLADALPVRPLIDGDVVKVALPLSEDHAIMRPSLTPGLIAVAERNIRQGAKSLRFFELGRTFRNAGGGKAKDLEADHLALLMGGDFSDRTWAGKPRSITLFDLKAIIQTLIPQATIQFAPRDRDGFLLACDIQADGKPIGTFAQLSPARARTIDAPGAIYLAELECKKLESLAKPAFHIDALPQFPGSSRDAAIEAPIDLANVDIEKAISTFRDPLLVGWQCFDLFTDPSGQKIAADKKSVVYRFDYRNDAKTLKQKEVDTAHQALLDHLTQKLKISFR